MCDAQVGYEVGYVAGVLQTVRLVVETANISSLASRTWCVRNRSTEAKHSYIHTHTHHRTVQYSIAFSDQSLGIATNG
jgi:hypothetical protein